MFKKKKEKKEKINSSKHRDNNDNENNNNQGNPLAVYKDNKGNLHIYSALCTHMGCTLTWNQSELSFNCPCHGSRFSAESGK
jgi:Rieske Fe-S protein